SGFMSFYVFEYLDSHRDLYNDLTSDEFQQTVFIDDQTVDDFIYYADEKGLKIDLDPYREDLKLHIKAILSEQLDRKSTRLNSSHVKISYAVLCLKKKKK